RRLAGAIDADDEDDVRLVGRIEHEGLGDRHQYALDFLGEHRAHVLLRNAFGKTALGERGRDARCRLDAEVRLEEDVLEIIEGVDIEAALREEAGYALRQLRRGLVQTGLEAREPASPLGRGGLGLDGFIAGSRYVG